MSTQSKIKEILQKMLSLPQAPQITIQVIEEYHAALGHWPDEVLDMAVLHYMSSETYFPPAGVLNNKVLDIQLLAMGIPTAAEAWSQVIGAIRFVQTVLCEKGDRLRLEIDGQVGGLYLSAVHTYGSHKDKCEICTEGGYQEIYGHPVVAETVRLLGGRDALMTDNPAADRKQFIDGYRERVSLEGRKYIMPPKIKEYIEATTRSRIAIESAVESRSVEDAMKQLTKGLSK